MPQTTTEQEPLSYTLYDLTAPLARQAFVELGSGVWKLAQGSDTAVAAAQELHRIVGRTRQYNIAHAAGVLMQRGDVLQALATIRFVRPPFSDKLHVELGAVAVVPEAFNESLASSALVLALRSYAPGHAVLDPHHVMQRLADGTVDATAEPVVPGERAEVSDNLTVVDVREFLFWAYPGTLLEEVEQFRCPPEPSGYREDK